MSAAAALDWLEAEAIHILREAVAELARPAMLFSGGKDSAVLLRLAEKAFWPAALPFPLLHVDTGHNFAEVLAFRDQRAREVGASLVVASVERSIAEGRVRDETGPRASRNRLQSVTLLDAIAQHQFDALFGGARRDEEKARAKERVFSVRGEAGAWEPKNQRPELWHLYNTAHAPNEHLRIFPLSNWTELDVWRYIEREGLTLPSIYFAHRRRVFVRDGFLMAAHDHFSTGAALVEERTVRFRTVGDVTCTAAVSSAARTVAEVITELAASRVTERGASRADDAVSDTAMEDRKKEGYF